MPVAASALRNRLRMMRHGSSNATLGKEAAAEVAVETAGGAVEDATEELAFLRKDQEKFGKLLEDAIETGNEEEQAHYSRELEAIRERMKALQTRDRRHARPPRTKRIVWRLLTQFACSSTSVALNMDCWTSPNTWRTQ